jgi:hypothetical protein
VHDADKNINDTQKQKTTCREKSSSLLGIPINLPSANPINIQFVQWMKHQVVHELYPVYHALVLKTQ